jgi:alpha-mannosidase
MAHGLRVLGPDDSQVEFGLVGDETTLATVSNPHELPLDQWVQRITIEFVAADVPPCGFARYRIEAGSGWPSGLYEAERLWVGPTIEDGGDVGDEYLYRAPLADVRLSRCVACCDDWGVTGTPVRQTVITTDSMSVPQTTAQGARSTRLVPMPVRLETTMWKGVPRAELRLTVENAAMDHRVRALFDASGVVSAAAPFDVVTRRQDPADVGAGAAPYHPMTLWFSASGVGEELGITVVAPGLYEYEPYVDDQGRTRQIGITLLRCVGQLSGRGDGPGIPTPGAQCLGSHTFDLAVFQHAGDWRAGEAWKHAHQFACPLVAVQAPRNDYAPATHSYMSVEPASLVISATKRAEDGDTLIVRCYNITDDPISEALISIPTATGWRRANLNEESDEPFQDGSAARLSVRPREIVSIEFAL